MHRQNDSWIGSCLDANGCLTLKQIVGSFTAPITEEHAWAIVYEVVKTLDLLLNNPSIFSNQKLVSATALEHVHLHQDGLVHEATFIQQTHLSHDRIPITSENKV